MKVKHFNMKLHLEKAPNVLQRRIGIDITPRAAGRILYSFLKKYSDILLLKAELTCRGLSTDGGWEKDLLRKFVDHEGNRERFLLPS